MFISFSFAIVYSVLVLLCTVCFPDSLALFYVGHIVIVYTIFLDILLVYIDLNTIRPLFHVSVSVSAHPYPDKKRNKLNNIGAILVGRICIRIVSFVKSVRIKWLTVGSGCGRQTDIIW